MTGGDELEFVLAKLKWLRLPGMAAVLQSLLKKAAEENLSTLDVIGRLADDVTRLDRWKRLNERHLA